MTKNDFLSRLFIEGKLELIEPTQEVCESYLDKSAKCLTSAKLLLENDLYENSISMSYYAMYNILTSLLFKVGIKCENHGASILLLKLIFHKDELFSIISQAKKERIDKQYYVTTQKDEVTKEIALELFHDAENVVLKIKVLLQQINNNFIEKARNELENLV